MLLKMTVYLPEYWISASELYRDYIDETKNKKDDSDEVQVLKAEIEWLWSKLVTKDDQIKDLISLLKFQFDEI